MFFDLNTPEKLYWMSRNYYGEQEIGYLLTKDQLLEALPEMYLTRTPEESSSRLRIPEMRKVNEYDLNRMVNNLGHCFTGQYADGDIFVVTELTKRSQVKDMMTWKNFKFDEGPQTEKLIDEYPDYVSDKFRLDKCVYKMDCFTSKHLPTKHEKNPTVDKYRKMLGIGNMRYKYTKEQEVSIEISNALQEGYLTPEVYKDIVLSSVLSRNDMAILEEYNELAASVIQAPEDGYDRFDVKLSIPQEQVESFTEALNAHLYQLTEEFPETQIDSGYENDGQEVEDYE